MSALVLAWMLTAQPTAADLLTDAVIMSVDDETYEENFS